MKIKIKKLHPDAVIPTYSKVGDAGMDFVAIDEGTGKDMYTEYRTGLSIEIPEGYVGLIFPRSSISKKAQRLTNSVGVIDSGYRGEIKFRFSLDRELQEAYLKQEIGKAMLGKDYDETFAMYSKGERIGQLIILPYPNIEFEEVEELSLSSRGEGGFGSTGL